MDDITLPALGENIESARVVKVLVSKGDEVEKDQPLIELETDKASFEFPSPRAGTVADVHVSEDDDVEVGTKLLSLERDANGDGTEDDSDQEEDEPESPPDDDAERQAEPDEDEDEDEDQDEEEDDGGEEDGDGEEADDEDESREADGGAHEDEDEDAEEPDRGADAKPEREPASGSDRDDEQRSDADDGPPAGPAARRLARELGIALDEVDGRGDGGRVTEDDVKRHARSLLAAAPRARDGDDGDDDALPDFARFGPVERQPLARIRRIAAGRLARAWRTVPHVTQHEDADVIDLERERRRANRQRGEDDPKLTPTAFVLKAIAVALDEFPRLASSLEPDGETLVVKRYRHLGVAVDTDDGLLVPVLRDVDAKSLHQVAAELEEVAARARDGALAPDDLEGSVFTLTNLGGIGGTSFTPIVPWPEVAILGLSRTREESGTLRLPLSLSYDHRVVDGAEGLRFLRRIAELLAHPVQLLGRG